MSICLHAKPPNQSDVHGNSSIKSTLDWEEKTLKAIMKIEVLI